VRVDLSVPGLVEDKIMSTIIETPLHSIPSDLAGLLAIPGITVSDRYLAAATKVYDRAINKGGPFVPVRAVQTKFGCSPWDWYPDDVDYAFGGGPLSHPFDETGAREHARRVGADVVGHRLNLGELTSDQAIILIALLHLRRRSPKALAGVTDALARGETPHGRAIQTPAEGALEEVLLYCVSREVRDPPIDLDVRDSSDVEGTSHELVGMSAEEKLELLQERNTDFARRLTKALAEVGGGVPVVYVTNPTKWSMHLDCAAPEGVRSPYLSKATKLIKIEACKLAGIPLASQWPDHAAGPAIVADDSILARGPRSRGGLWRPAEGQKWDKKRNGYRKGRKRWLECLDDPRSLTRTRLDVQPVPCDAEVLISKLEEIERSPEVALERERVLSMVEALLSGEIPRTRSRSTPRAGAEDPGQAEDSGVTELPTTPGELPESLATRIKQDGDLSRKWSLMTSGKKIDRSQTEYWFIFRCALLGWEEKEILGALLALPNGKVTERGEGYYWENLLEPVKRKLAETGRKWGAAAFAAAKQPPKKPLGTIPRAPVETRGVVAEAALLLLAGVDRDIAASWLVTLGREPSSVADAIDKVERRMDDPECLGRLAALARRVDGGRATDLGSVMEFAALTATPCCDAELRAWARAHLQQAKERLGGGPKTVRTPVSPSRTDRTPARLAMVIGDLLGEVRSFKDRDKVGRGIVRWMLASRLAAPLVRLALCVGGRVDDDLVSEVEVNVEARQAGPNIERVERILGRQAIDRLLAAVGEDERAGLLAPRTARELRKRASRTRAERRFLFQCSESVKNLATDKSKNGVNTLAPRSERRHNLAKSLESAASCGRIAQAAACKGEDEADRGHGEVERRYTVCGRSRLCPACRETRLALRVQHGATHWVSGERMELKTARLRLRKLEAAIAATQRKEPASPAEGEALVVAAKAAVARTKIDLELKQAELDIAVAGSKAASKELRGRKEVLENRTRSERFLESYREQSESELKALEAALLVAREERARVTFGLSLLRERLDYEEDQLAVAKYVSEGHPRGVLEQQRAVEEARIEEFEDQGLEDALPEAKVVALGSKTLPPFEVGESVKVAKMLVAKIKKDWPRGGNTTPPLRCVIGPERVLVITVAQESTAPYLARLRALRLLDEVQTVTREEAVAAACRQYEDIGDLMETYVGGHDEKGLVACPWLHPLLKLTSANKAGKSVFPWLTDAQLVQLAVDEKRRETDDPVERGRCPRWIGEGDEKRRCGCRLTVSVIDSWTNQVLLTNSMGRYYTPREIGRAAHEVLTKECRSPSAVAAAG
jgi:hypothetical protein